jgi:hypothetical protein
MIHYLKKAFIRRNLDDVCEFMHNEIDKTSLEVNKVLIKKLSDLDWHVIKNYTVKAIFYKDNRNTPDEFDKLYRKVKTILEDTPLSVIVTHDDSIHSIILGIGINTSWLEEKDAAKSLTSISTIVKFSL